MKTRLFRLFPSAFFIFALGTLLLISCNREFETEVPDDDFVEMFITVGDDTKTLNDGLSTSWTTGDALSVIHSAPNVNTFWLSPFYWQGANAFSGKVSKLSSQNDWYAVYPYDAGHVSAENISLTFPKTQEQTGNSSMSHLAGETFPMLGKAEDVDRSVNLNIKVKNVLAVEKYLVKNTSELPLIVKEIEFTAPYPITGEFTVDMTGDDPVLTANANASKTVKLSIEGGEQIAAGDEATFYMAVAPFEASAGEELIFKITGEHPDNPGVNVYFYHTITLKQDISFASNSINSIGLDFDDNSQNPDAGAACEVDLELGEQPQDGDYLLVYEDGENSMAFAAFAAYKTQKYAIPVTVVDGVVIPQNGEDLSRFAVNIENFGIEHPNDAGHDAYNVRNSDGYYVFYSTGGGNLDASDALQIKETNEMDIDGTTYKYYHTFVQEEDGVQILSSISGASGGNKYLLAYSTEKGFYYEENNSGQKLHLYLLGGSAKEHQQLTFSTENVTYNFDANGEGPLTGAPTLSGNKTPVTWSSNNTSVATVNANGSVSIHGPGIAVITAKAEANEMYYSGSASYTIEVTSSTVQTWYKADEMEAGKQYLIVSNGYALQNNDGTVAATTVTVNDEVIMMNAPAAILWTATSDQALTNNGQYLRRSTSSSGSGGWGGWGGWGGTSTQELSIGNQSSTPANHQWSYDADHNYVMSDTYYLYYSTNNSKFSISTTASETHIATLYGTTKPANKQVLRFENSSVRWTVGDGGDHVLNQSYDVQAVSGAETTVTYTSSDSDVATINGTRITLNGTGTTTITATAKEENGYKSATAQYTLRVSSPAPSGFVDLGTFNLENSKVKAFLDRAYSEYTDSNLSTTIVASFVSGASSTNRLDVPNPVTIDWGTRSSGTTTITIFSDQGLKDEVWVQTASSGSTSDAVYNLMPGKTYYCTVEDNSGYLLKGVFETEGRRRMMRVSTTASQSNANNCRDLGGMSTTDGRKIKYGMIFRGTNLDGTKNKTISNYVAPNDSEQGLLANYMNVGYDIDLRAGGTQAFTSSYSVVYVLGNMDADINSCTSASNARPTIQGFFDAAAAGKASYFHCAIGSDRTGFWGLLIEGLLGVSIKECSIDYELTSFANNVTYGNRTRNSGLFSDGISFLNKQTGSTLKEQATSYVKSLGFTDAQIEAFRNAVLE